MANPEPRAPFVFIREWPYSPVRLQFQRCGVVGCRGALLRERLRYAFDHGCDLAMMVAAAGSDSQRNAERKGFQIAYTRIKWRLSSNDR